MSNLTGSLSYQKFTEGTGFRIRGAGYDNSCSHNHDVASHPLINKYFVMAVEGQSPLTLKCKKQDLGRFLQYYQKIKGHTNFEEWLPAITRGLIDELRQKGYAPSTINRNLASLKSFSTWLREERIISHNPTKNIRSLHLPPLAPKRIEDDEWMAIRGVAEELATESPEHERNLVLLRLLEGTGLRISELLGLTVQNFQYEKNLLSGVYCKGSRIRDIPISSECSQLLYCFVQSRNLRSRERIFANYRGGNLSRVGLAKALNLIAEEASKRLKSPIVITPHKFRHRHAYKCRMKFGDVWAASRLGHSSLSYLNRYSLLDNATEQELVEGL